MSENPDLPHESPLSETTPSTAPLVNDDDRPIRIAVLGAGPISLEVALYGRYLGHEVCLYDADEVCGGWIGGTNEMSSFRENYTPLALAAIGAQDARFESPNPDDCLTIDQWCERYCLPLAKTDLVRRGLRTRHEVKSIEFDSASETYTLVAHSANGETAETYDYIIDTRQITSATSDKLEELAEFPASKTDDFIVMDRSHDGFSFRAATKWIVRLFAMIGERDDLDIYRSMEQYRL